MEKAKTKFVVGMILGLLIVFALYGIKTFFERYEIVSPIQTRILDIDRGIRNGGLKVNKTTPKPSTKPTSLIPIAIASADSNGSEGTRTDFWYKLFIYEHESGNDPTKYNSSGCVGLGQACPASKLLTECPTLDYTCEDNFFDNYANVRYGGWEQAYELGMSRGTTGINDGWGWW